MATSLSGSLDLTQIALKIIENTYGLVFISVLLALITLVVLFIFSRNLVSSPVLQLIQNIRVKSFTKKLSIKKSL